MKEQEKKLKEKFYSSPFAERAKIKRELTVLQEKMFDKKWSCGKSMSIDIKNEEMIQRLENSTGPATDPHHLAELIKKELREGLDGSRKFEAGDRVGDIWEANQSREICYFGRKKEINELIANLARNRQKPLDRDKITTRMVRVKQEDFSSTDFEEMISLIRQMKNFLEEKDKQDHQRTENIKLNNPHLFTQWKCSTDGKYNGRGKWENWHTFSGKRNGHNYTIYVPDNHIALTNCLFDNGWGTNSEVGKFFVVKGVVEPTALRYWNVEKQKQEIISEAEAQRLEQQGKGNFIKYETYVELNNKIFIDHYQENGQQESVNPVSGVNGLIENTNDKNMSVGLISEGEKENSELDKEGLLKIFQKYSISQMSLTTTGDLLIEYNSGKSEVWTKERLNQSEFKKVIGYYQTSGQTSLSQQELNNLLNTATPRNSNNTLLIASIIGGALVLGIVVGLFWRKRKISKN
ncbi:MAG: hypothetical protein MRERV_56c001 [Mycoplasmataceae bacterium RV_VA103A]|nr:MAG: hypothetical protein MRERV_56c001 [Mycoplasmataceae bacterium RV_VA103A]